jgi:hypothetical protein
MPNASVSMPKKILVYRTHNSPITSEISPDISAAAISIISKLKIPNFDVSAAAV